MKKQILAAVIAMLASGASAATLVNGSFENPVGTGAVLPISGSMMPGWTVTAGNVEIIRHVGIGWKPTDGSQSIDLNGVSPGTIQQTISDFVVGASYLLSFDMGGNYYSNAASQTANASIAGVNANFTHMLSPGDALTDFTWQEKTLAFTATSTTHDLVFSQVTFSAAAGAALDNVRLELVTAPVPLPGSALLLMAGVGGLSLLRKRRA